MIKEKIAIKKQKVRLLLPSMKSLLKSLVIIALWNATPYALTHVLDVF